MKEKLSVRSATQITKIQKRYTDAPSTPPSFSNSLLSHNLKNQEQALIINCASPSRKYITFMYSQPKPPSISISPIIIFYEFDARS